jgi:soluble cytochrome b562
LLTGWQLEIQDLAYLQRAKNLAASGTTADLEAAIKEASQIPAANPRAQEAASTIASWRRQIQIVQDQPYIQAAEQLASAGNIQALQQAIAQLQQLQPGRALYADAQRKISQWTAQIQRMQDAPILENAELQARNGNISAAIATASQIGSGRALYGQAQARIGEWNGDNDARQKLVGAQQLANQGTPEALLGAIEAVSDISSGSSVYKSARAAMNKWSSQMFQQARSAAASDLDRAIAIARAIPAGSAAYGTAQQAIQQWENAANGSQPSGF